MSDPILQPVLADAMKNKKRMANLIEDQHIQWDVRIIRRDNFSGIDNLREITVTGSIWINEGDWSEAELNALSEWIDNEEYMEIASLSGYVIGDDAGISASELFDIADHDEDSGDMLTALQAIMINPMNAYGGGVVNFVEAIYNQGVNHVTYLDKGASCLGSIYVHPLFRRLGVGSKLLREYIEVSSHYSSLALLSSCPPLSEFSGNIEQVKQYRNFLLKNGFQDLDVLEEHYMHAIPSSILAKTDNRNLYDAEYLEKKASILAIELENDLYDPEENEPLVVVMPS